MLILARWILTNSFSGWATKRLELQGLVTASGFDAPSIAGHQLAVIAASRAKLTSRKAAQMGE
jgi:hypothetical protein